MAHTESLYHAPSLSSASPHKLVAGAMALIKEWRLRARGRRELAALSDRCLRDIGITRNDAAGEINKPFWRA